MKWIWLVLLCACMEPELSARTQVVVALYADRALALSRVEVEVRDEAGSAIVNQHAFDPLGELPLSFGVYQPAHGADWFMLFVRGFSGAQRVVEYKVIAQFVPGKTGLLSVTLASRCAGVFCDANPFESCYADVGRCVPIVRETPRAELDDGGSAVSEVLIMDASVDAAMMEPPSMVAAPVPPSRHGFSAGGGRRGDGVLMISRDGFEQGERRCTADRRYCVTGSLSP